MKKKLFLNLNQQKSTNKERELILGEILGKDHKIDYHRNIYDLFPDFYSKNDYKIFSSKRFLNQNVQTKLVTIDELLERDKQREKELQGGYSYLVSESTHRKSRACNRRK